MSVLTYSDARANFKTVMDRAIDDHEEVIVTRRNGEAVVVVSMEDWSSITETLYLLSTPANADALRDSIAELDRSAGQSHDLVKP